MSWNRCGRGLGFSNQTVNYALDRRSLDVRIRGRILPGHEDTWSPCAGVARRRHAPGAGPGQLQRSGAMRGLFEHARCRLGGGLQRHQAPHGRVAPSGHRLQDLHQGAPGICHPLHEGDPRHRREPADAADVWCPEQGRAAQSDLARVRVARYDCLPSIWDLGMASCAAARGDQLRPVGRHGVHPHAVCRDGGARGTTGVWCCCPGGHHGASRPRPTSNTWASTTRAHAVAQPGVLCWRAQPHPAQGPGR